MVKFSQKNIGNSREMKSFSIIMIKVIFGWFINCSALHVDILYCWLLIRLTFFLLFNYSQDLFNTNCITYTNSTSGFISCESHFESKPTHFQSNRTGKTTSFSNTLWLPLLVTLTGMGEKPIAQLLNAYTDSLWLQNTFEH